MRDTHLLLSFKPLAVHGVNQSRWLMALFSVTSGVTSNLFVNPCQLIAPRMCKPLSRTWTLCSRRMTALKSPLSRRPSGFRVSRTTTTLLRLVRLLRRASPLSPADETTVQQNFFSWQSLQPDSGPNGDFFKFCDALEVKNGVSAPASGWGLDNALQAWGSYWKNSFYVQSTLRFRHLLYFLLISPWITSLRLR